MPLGRVLKNIRIARNLSREEVADPHYSVSHLAAVEQGVKRPSIKMLIHVADRLRVSLEMLVPEILENSIPVPEKIRLARALCREDQYELAMKILQQANEEDGRQGGQYRVDRLETEAFIEHLRGNYDQAIRGYAEVSRIRERGGNPYLTAKAYYGLARVELKRRRADCGIHWLFLSLDRLRPEVAEHPEFAFELLRTYGDTLLQLGRVRAAESAYETALEYAPCAGDGSASAEVHHRIGTCLKKRGEFAEAGDHLREAQDNDSLCPKRRAEMLVDLGAVLRLSGDPDGAMPHLTEAHRLQEDAGVNPLASINEIMACLLEQKAHQEEMDAWCDLVTSDLLEGAPARERARYGHLKALYLHHRGDSARALREAQRAFDAVPAGERRLSGDIMISILRMARDGESADEMISWAVEHIDAIAND